MRSMKKLSIFVSIVMIFNLVVIPVFADNNPKDALQNALDFSDNSIVCVCGSLYLAGEIKKIFHKK